MENFIFVQWVLRSFITGHGPGTGIIVGIIFAILVAIILVVVVMMCYVKKRNGGKSHVMYYKDMSTTPLEEDFDVEHFYNEDKTKIVAENLDTSWWWNNFPARENSDKYSEPCQTYKTKPFPKIVKDWRPLKLLAI